MQVQWCGYYEVVGTLKLYLMQKNLFKLFALIGSGDAKTLAALKPPGETFITFTTHQQSCRTPPPEQHLVVATDKTYGLQAGGMRPTGIFSSFS